MPEDFWFSTPKKRIMVFSLPGESGLTEVAGDFKIHFQDRQGDFYCWLNTTMIENRMVLNTSDLDAFDKRKLPSPGFQVEIVLDNYDGSSPRISSHASPRNETDAGTATIIIPVAESNIPLPTNTNNESPNKDDVFSDNEAEGGGSSKGKSSRTHIVKPETSEKEASSRDQTKNLTTGIEQVSLKAEGAATATASKAPEPRSEVKKSSLPYKAPEYEPTSASEFKAIAADASVFSFGDEDYDSE